MIDGLAYVALALIGALVAYGIVWVVVGLFV